MARATEKDARRARFGAELRRRLGCPFLTIAEAATYLRVSEKTLNDHRISGKGPTYRKHFGRVSYHVDDLEAWSARQRRASTSDKADRGRDRDAVEAAIAPSVVDEVDAEDFEPSITE